MKKLIPLAFALLAMPALADDAKVQSVSMSNSGGSYTFSVTISHPDTGWDHYVDAWRVVAPDGTVLGMRKLAHPHVDEQPFTRSLSGVSIPEGITSVVIEAHDNVDGWSPNTKTVTLR
ncbi:hypothetical protein KDD17_16160 [Sulfitobacter albidus]|uniref:Uncharacterized protein n=1 Tax=Sulfitobacter albidus TaxID=2829501 RepID=A0A975JE60_9RHOB|nr:hypothetical protein [Sulfitobacter albidus]QUJ76395.1 hypothetical protein KDD17_16160 [Sulfitobacter albidus]